jgi:hypothetical protein
VVGDRGVLLPLVGGIAGGTATVLAAAKFQWHPVAVAAAAAVGGVALSGATKTPWLKQAALGAAIGAGTLGGVTLAGQLLQPKPAASHGPTKTSHRAADGSTDGFVTKMELQNALAQHAETQKEQQKQQTCDLMTALRDEIRRTVGDMNAPKPPAANPQQGPATFLHTIVPPRGAEERDYGEHDYMRDAYGDERDAMYYEVPHDYLRDAYGEERDAAYEERDAGYEERDAVAYEERDATYEERDATYEERDAEVEG